MKRWTLLIDAEDVIDNIPIKDEWKIGGFISSTRGGKGKVWRVREGRKGDYKEYITLSTKPISWKQFKANGFRFRRPEYRHDIISLEGMAELEIIILENKL